MKSVAYFLLVALLIWIVAVYGGSTFGISLSGGNTYISALIFAVVLAIVNVILGTILRVLTLPLNFLTLGLVSFLITLLMIYVTDSLVDSITISGLLGYLVMAAIPAIASAIISKK